MIERLRLTRLLVLAMLCLLAGAARAEAQFGSLVSPGPLSRAHASLEGGANCEKCHERGRKVTAEKCLTCHKPVADRIAAKRGVHRYVTTDCVECHVEHAGVDAQLRPFDLKKFNHAPDTGFPLDGRHAAIANDCARCHKTRSFLTANPACSACHADAHKGSLGVNCIQCHTTRDPFMAATRTFNHAVTQFPLAGAHARVACETCHGAKGYTGIAFARCTDCHKNPHPPAQSTACLSCHTNDSWHTKKFDHSKTAFPLIGKHAGVECGACHTAPATRSKPASATCATCHADPHGGEFQKDCKACHTETGFAGAVFDHTATRFPLTDGHAKPACTACHKSVAIANVPLARVKADFRGPTTACASCHDDPHKTELGAACESCHSARTFRVATYVHPRATDLFVGAHAAAACAACHKPPAETASRGRLADARFKTTPTACASCHADPHLGQVGPACETCHSLTAAKFAPDRFSHDRTAYRLTGKHAQAVCTACHKTETAAFPAGRGTAVRLTSLETDCASCHGDVHLGQLGSTCESCHTTSGFTVRNYTHRNPPPEFFVGQHLAAVCADCHKRDTGTFPSGRGTAMRFAVSAECVSCHVDPHRGALGLDCGRCHRPEPLAASHLSPSPALASLIASRRLIG